MSKRHQQGDIKLHPIAALPKGAKRLMARDGRYVLAEGEATGPPHAVAERPGVEMYEHEGTLFLRVEKPADLVHEEHATQVVEPGLYEVGRVLEYDYLEEQMRQVRD